MNEQVEAVKQAAGRSVKRVTALSQALTGLCKYAGISPQMAGGT